MQFHHNHVALGKLPETPKLFIEVSGVKCQALLDSGASVSLISEITFNKCSNPILRTVDLRKLQTANGSKMNLVAEVCLEISTGGLRSSQ